MEELLPLRESQNVFGSLLPTSVLDEYLRADPDHSSRESNFRTDSTESSRVPLTGLEVDLSSRLELLEVFQKLFGVSLG